MAHTWNTANNTAWSTTAPGPDDFNRWENNIQYLYENRRTGNAVASDLVFGKFASSQGSVFEGTIPDYRGLSVAAASMVLTIVSGNKAANSLSLTVPECMTDRDTRILAFVAGLFPANVTEDRSIFGVPGSMPLHTFQSGVERQIITLPTVRNVSVTAETTVKQIIFGLTGRVNISLNINTGSAPGGAIAREYLNDVLQRVYNVPGNSSLGGGGTIDLVVVNSDYKITLCSKVNGQTSKANEVYVNEGGYTAMATTSHVD